MKKLFTIILVTIAASLTITACTEEEVTPRQEAINSGRPLDPM